jgi:hypothetical protein
MPHPTILQLSHGSFKIWEKGSNSEKIGKYKRK